MKSPFTLLFSCCFLLVPSWARGGADFQLANGDRVVLVGNTLIEREQRHGYWETMLTAHYPDKNIQFRNLGWCGDTVFGEAQARFGTAADGFQHLKEHVLALKPTVIIAGYGANESFAGEAGLPRFREGLTTLLNMLQETKARLVLLSPLHHEDLGRPLPDPAEHNRNLQLYRDVLRQTAEKRGLHFVNLYDLVPDGARLTPPQPFTDNGIHLTAYGYWISAVSLRKGLILPSKRWRIEIDTDKKMASRGTQLSDLQNSQLRFETTDAILPLSPPPELSSVGAKVLDDQRRLQVGGLKPGKYVLHIDGKPVVTAPASEWAKGVTLTKGPEFDQVERLRQAIIEKNQLYFHRWRPQNETYLFGFRKQEQGQNAKEIPEFDPLVAKLEADIAKLRRPGKHRYELVPESGVNK